MASNRCTKCKYKSSIILECKCKKYYCTKHILPEIHECIELEKIRRDSYEKNKLKLLEDCKKEKPEWII